MTAIAYNYLRAFERAPRLLLAASPATQSCSVVRQTNAGANVLRWVPRTSTPMVRALRFGRWVRFPLAPASAIQAQTRGLWHFPKALFHFYNSGIANIRPLLPRKLVPRCHPFVRFDGRKWKASATGYCALSVHVQL